jgi:enoyl-CoA hydratase/carnithine racemase
VVAAVLVEAEELGNVRVLRLNRPETGNALSPDLLHEFGDRLMTALDDEEVRVVILTGAGERAFCTGMDLKSLAHGSSDAALGDPVGFSALPAGFFQGEFAKPLIAAVNGMAVGGGFEMALASDLIVAAEGATFSMPEVRRGLLPGRLMTSRLPLSIALEIALTGESIEAERAMALGMVNRVVPRTVLMDTAIEIAGQIARNGPLAVRTAKFLFRQHSRAASELSQDEARLSAQVFASADAREGARSFVEKRLPIWTGR